MKHVLVCRIAAPVLLAGLCALTAGCGSESSSGPRTAAATAADASSPDAGAGGLVQLTMSPGEAGPGGETILCEYLAPLEKDLYITRLDTFQQAGGHHLVFYRWLGAEKAAGVIEDCAEGKTMSQMMLVLTPIVAPKGNTAHVEFPAGMALHIAAGTQLVAQYHYINATDQPIPFRDVARLRTVPVEQVKQVVRTFGFGSLDYSLPPGKEYTDSFACDVPYDMKPVVAFPHMHHLGVRFRADVGTAGVFVPFIDVARWEPGMRDVPPLTNWLAEPPPTPAVFHRGEQIRTFCTWVNTTSAALGFPEEMCATAGYFTADDPAADNLICTGTTKVAATP